MRNCYKLVSVDLHDPLFAVPFWLPMGWVGEAASALWGGGGGSWGFRVGRGFQVGGWGWGWASGMHHVSHAFVTNFETHQRIVLLKLKCIHLRIDLNKYLLCT